MIQAAEIEQMTFAAGGHAGNCGPTSDHLHHPQAKTWFEVQGDASCGFCRVTQMALLRHLTNAKIKNGSDHSMQRS